MILKIPEVRQRLHDLADRIGGIEGDYLHFLAEATRRRTPISRAPRQKQVRPPRAVLLAYKKAHPELSNHKVAIAFGMANHGRVTDIIRGTRH